MEKISMMGTEVFLVMCMRICMVGIALWIIMSKIRLLVIDVLKEIVLSKNMKNYGVLFRRQSDLIIIVGI